uniref:Fluoride-specific ion channel FluC n=1 Tax=candidate division WOR-3 bacterium TaxID=2052148 RepID=A0A7C3N5X9_UNCW3
MKIILSIMFGGALGALLRFFISRWVSNIFGIIFPFGTLLINLSGSLLIGIFYGLSERIIIGNTLRAFITVGLLGAFTTFSTFAFENMNLFKDGEFKLGFINILLTNIFGIIFVFLGFIIVGLIYKN